MADGSQLNIFPGEDWAKYARKGARSATEEQWAGLIYYNRTTPRTPVPVPGGRGTPTEQPTQVPTQEPISEPVPNNVAQELVDALLVALLVVVVVLLIIVLVPVVIAGLALLFA
jgi:hypothetical protein